MDTPQQYTPVSGPAPSHTNPLSPGPAPTRGAASLGMVRASQSAQTPKPLELGAKLLCRWRGDEVKPCEVLERQQNEDSGEWEYCACSPRRDRLPRPSPCAPPAPSRRALRGDEPAHGRVGAAGPLRPGLGDRGGQADTHVEAQVRPRGARGGGRAGPGDAQGA